MLSAVMANRSSSGSSAGSTGGCSDTLASAGFGLVEEPADASAAFSFLDLSFLGLIFVEDDSMSRGQMCRVSGFGSGGGD